LFIRKSLLLVKYANILFCIMSDFIVIFLLVSFGSLLALVGGLVFLFVPKLNRVLTDYSVPFAGGVLLTVTLLSILPEASKLVGHTAFYITLITFLTIYVFENLFFELHHHEHEEGLRNKNIHIGHDPTFRSAWFIMVGDTIHNFIDGVAITASYLINPGLGIITAISTFLHEVPHEIGDFGILLKAKWRNKNIIATNLISASFSLLGAFVVLVWQPADTILGALLSISAGVFLYFGASDFIPHTDSHLPKSKTIFALLLGVSLMVISSLLIPHAH